MKPIYFFALVAIGLISCKAASDQAGFTILLAEYNEYLKNQPKYDGDQWPTRDTAKLAAELPIYTAWLTRLQSVDTLSLSPDQRINKDMLELLWQEKVDNIAFGSHLMPLNAEGGFLTGLLNRLQQQELHRDDRATSYTQLLQDLPRYMRQQRGLMEKGMALKKISPKLIVDNCIQLLEKGINLEGMQHQLATITNDSLRSVATNMVNDSVYQSIVNFLTFMKEEYMTSAPEAIGIAQVPGGKKYYEDRIRYFTTYDITPDEVFNTGQREVARIRAEMEQIIKTLGFKGDFAAFLEFLRTDERFYFKSRRELLYYASWLSKKIEGELPRFFNKLPRMPFTVKPVPAAIAENYTSGRYSSGSYDNKKAGEYWVNTTKLDSRPKYALPALTLHEAVPGHHLQIMLAAEIENVPDFRKNTYLSAYGEGWALYTEWLGIEAGMYEDPYDDFGRLTYEMWRACRLVVDVGMHYKNWTREEAVDFMSGNTALSLHEVNTEINRYIGWPAQAVSYKMGEIKIRELRKRAESSLGDKFDIRSFHDEILANGSIPLTSLERAIDQYILMQIKG